MARGYLRNILIGVDQLVNAATGGYPDETVSSRCGRLIHRSPYKYWAKLIDAIFRPFQGPGHCVKTYRKELTRYQFPPEMREDSNDQPA